jgi:protein phosphatase
LRIHSYVLAVAPGAQFLLCSDGLHGVIPAGSIRDCLGQDSSLESKCRSLVNAARQAGGPDNITAVVLRAA